jgi:transposase
MTSTTSTAEFQAQIAQLNKRNSELETTVAELSAMVRHFQELFKISQMKRFGASSEKDAGAFGQLSLFGDPQPAVVPAAAPETEEITYTRKKQQGKREADLSKLPLEIVEHELPEEARRCPDCGEVMQDFGADTRDEIKIIQAQVVHVQHRRHVYKCDDCAKTAEKTPIVKASMPEPVIKGSVASASAVAYIMTQKHLMHLPFYRLEQDFQRQGVFLNRQNMTNWSIRVCEDWLKPIYDQLRCRLLEHDCLHGDETTLQVLHEPGKTAQQKSYMWLYRTSGESKTPVVYYEYQPSREGEHPEAFLKGWRGYLHTDGYSAYHDLDGVTVIGCWAHVRRKFNDAYKIAKAPDSPAKIGLDFCTRLFALEKEFADLPPDERLEARLEKSKPVSDAFFAWAETVNVPPKLAISRALIYALNQRKFLENIFLDGRLELSNNRAERSVKPFVMGRKNWLFCDSMTGAKASATAFSIIETAKENKLKPFEYLQFLLETLPNATTSRLDDLLPWSTKLPPECRVTN